MTNNFDDLETTTRKSALIQERMSLVSNYMYKQFVEYQQSNLNTAIIMDKIAENMAITVEYLKQSFNMRGIPTQNIYFEYNKQQHIAVINILWHSVTFIANMKDSPKALERTKDLPSMISGRIIAIKGNVSELQQGYNEEIEKKLLDMEIASLYVPSDKTAKAIMKVPHLVNQEFLKNQIEAPRDFLLRVIEMVCRDGNFHKESSRFTLSI